MTPEQRLRWIQRVEAAGYTVEATEYGNVMILTVWGAIRHVARSIGYGRYDWEEIGRQFHRFQSQGSRTHRTVKARRAA